RAAHRRRRRERGGAEDVLQVPSGGVQGAQDDRVRRRHPSQRGHQDQPRRPRRRTGGPMKPLSRHYGLVKLERAGWKALSAGTTEAATFYDEILDSEVLFLLPGGMVLDDRAQVLQSLGGPGWDAFELNDERVLELTPDIAVVAYRATARRAGTTYTAVM